ncbi:MAG: restriction endonuclease subunit S [Candidatus Electrothrix sp. AR3]|nr:restriction endonuclease subunit S [Candidatus Electrothrix sp. AR3]
MSDSVVVPDGWEIKRLGDFSKPSIKKNSTKKDIPVLSITKYDGFVNSHEYFKKQIFSRDLSGYKIVQKGDFAYATIHLDEGSIGLLKQWNKGLISPMYSVFTTDSNVNKDFLFFLLKSDGCMKKYPTLGQGSINRRASIPFSVLSQVPLPLPPLPEQKKIATILTSVDEVIEKTTAQISKLQDLKKAMMSELLTKGIGHTAFKDSPVGRIPKSWHTVSYAEVVKKNMPSFCLTDEGNYSPVIVRRRHNV